ncbi:MAG: hypothetical protein A2277_19875 [Desulfobacterales bacterium RIFOXYA12_FULL_46_15]|nr:MAG: hypothetical protein A2097_10880 [Desulfobacula sp. GWF2_41_7]OGR26974.1 MAG: hypothetical protein A2277_19875 [Desulfobacterales bacterium RIFOXYA12_FULL_46_15]
MEETRTKLKRIKIDSIYGKKKHFNAADRIERWHYWLGIPLVLINIITGSVLCYVITDGQTSWIKFIPLFLSLIATVLSGLQTFFNFQKKVEGHRRIGNKYLFVMKKCDRLEGYIVDGIIEKNSIAEEVEIIAAEANSINQEAESFPTSKKDYDIARQGVLKGEESYSEKDLEL